MAKTIQRLTGMHDVLPDDRRYWDAITLQAAKAAALRGFQRVDLPILEATDLFSRGVGIGSDFFVQKEMYTLEESDGPSITLRPEFTAGFVRAYIENGMGSWPPPVKLYTIGPAFRRERPQAGRYRQHSQFNSEILGEEDPAADVEVMMLALDLLHALGFHKLVFQLNSTGCPVCKPAYIEELKAYINQHLDKLADVDKERLQRNPLRILDSKEPGMDALLADAPHIIDHLCEDCETHFADVRAMLDELDQAYAINFRLVRGIDYYTKTVFEIWQEGIGAQASLLGGGRYDGLAEDIGGPATPGVGFGAGIERIILGMKEQGIEPREIVPAPIFIAHFGGATKTAAVSLAELLRQAGLGVRMAFARERRSMKSQMREANRRQARVVVIIGDDELANNTLVLRPLDGGDQVTVQRSDLMARLNALLSQEG